MSTDRGGGCRAGTTVAPLSGRCAEVVERAENACFGISVFNHQPPAVLRRLWVELTWQPAAGQGFAVAAPAV